jgi:hypothetical protein
MKCFYSVLLASIITICLSGAAQSITLTCPAPSTAISVPANANTAQIQNLITGVAPGTTLMFPAGIYAITDMIFLSSGVSLQGSLDGGTVFISQTGQPMFFASNVSDIDICAIHFDGNLTGGSQNPNGAALLVEGCKNIHITYNLFTNNAQEVDLKLFNSDDVYFQGNASIGPNEWQPIAAWMTDGKPHKNFYVTDNLFNNWTRDAVEVSGTNSTITDWHFDRNAFIKDFSVQPIVYQQLAVYAGTLQNSNSTIWGNSFTVNGANQQGGGVTDWAIEVWMPNISIEENITFNVLMGVVPSHCPGCEIENNSFNNYSTYWGGPFSQDGGYDHTEWIGWNVLNGTWVQGWPGGTTDYGPRPPVYQPSPPFL